MVAAVTISLIVFLAVDLTCGDSLGGRRFSLVRDIEQARTGCNMRRQVPPLADRHEPSHCCCCKRVNVAVLPYLSFITNISRPGSLLGVVSIRFYMDIRMVSTFEEHY